MQRVTEALAWLRTMDAITLPHIRSVLATIIQGQKLDIRRFPGTPLRSLSAATELDEYTYLVAGCVGEFWTKLCFERMTDPFVDGTTEGFAIKQGIRFGKGLQLVNILRDIGKDARLGRCYLPSEQHALTPSQIEAQPAMLRTVWREWLAPCEDHLRAGLEYVQALNHSTLRYATALPLMLAARTLALMKRASDAELVAGVKVSRFDVTRLLAQTALANSPAKLGKLFGVHASA
jgi:farnesyl-diphosphate farnesyltransferase